MAIVGCGTISQLNAPGYLAHESCEVTALFDPQTDRAEQRARQWGINPSNPRELRRPAERRQCGCSRVAHADNICIRSRLLTA